jgi:hypothetical protein
MNFETIIQGLFQIPAFQSVVRSIIDDLLTKLFSGVSPAAVAQQGVGQMAAAAAFHLTGNPVADIASLLASLKSPAGAAPAPAAAVVPANLGAPPTPTPALKPGPAAPTFKS